MSNYNPTYRVPSNSPLNVPTRPWVLDHSWLRYFPIGMENVVTFSPPWPFPALKVGDKPTALQLVSLMRKGLYIGLIAWVLVTALLFCLILSHPCFFLVEFLALWGIRLFMREVWLPREALTILGDTEVVRAEKADKRMNGEAKSPGSEQRILATIIALGAGWASGIYWWRYEILPAYIAGVVTVAALIWGITSCMRIGRSREWSFPAKVALAAGYGILIIAYLIGLNWLVSPLEPKDMGRWGYKRSSPSSEALAIMQSVMPPYQTDRLLLFSSYRSLGIRMEWTVYMIDPERFSKMKKSIMSNNSLLVVEGYLSTLNEEKVEYLTKRNKRERYPEWWEVKEKMEYMTLFFSGDVEQIDNQRTIKRKFENGEELNIITDNVRPVSHMRYEIMYDADKSRMYFRMWDSKSPPWVYIIR